MCGIVGALTKDPSKRISLTKHINGLAHRGPDSKNEWHDHNIHLGHSRLAILDLTSAADQPLSYLDGRYIITYNGEIYNYLEIRKVLINLGHRFKSTGDTEVLLAAYAEWGSSCLEKLRGMFAFGIWDRDNSSLFLARDRVGEKPLYYYFSTDCLFFASELKSIINLIPTRPELNPVSIDLFIHYQYVPEPYTPLKDIRKLPAGHYLEINIDKFNPLEKCYWNFNNIKPIQADGYEHIKHELYRSIELSLRADVPVGIALSGGIDSTCIATIAKNKYKADLTAFSIGYPGRPDFDERNYALKTASTLGIPFFDLELTTDEFIKQFPALIKKIDDPIADIAAYGHYAVMELACNHGIKVMLSGLGGDELFWGYSWVVEAVNLTIKKRRILNSDLITRLILTYLSNLQVRSYPRRLMNSARIPEILRKLLYIFDYSNLNLNHSEYAVFYDIEPGFNYASQNYREIYTRDFLDTIPRDNAYSPFGLDVKNCEEIPLKISEFLFNTWFVSNCLSLGDRISMSTSVETRLPLVDYRLVEVVFGTRKLIPDHNLGHKHYLKNILRDIIPSEVLNRRKRGFQPPYEQWISSIISNYKDNLFDGSLSKFKMFNTQYIEYLCNNSIKNNDAAFLLYKLILLEFWYKIIVLQD